jgi:hypothetical protein
VCIVHCACALCIVPVCSSLLGRGSEGEGALRFAACDSNGVSASCCMLHAACCMLHAHLNLASRSHLRLFLCLCIISVPAYSIQRPDSLLQPGGVIGLGRPHPNSQRIQQPRKGQLEVPPSPHLNDTSNCCVQTPAPFNRTEARLWRTQRTPTRRRG